MEPQGTICILFPRGTRLTLQCCPMWQISVDKKEEVVSSNPSSVQPNVTRADHFPDRSVSFGLRNRFHGYPEPGFFAWVRSWSPHREFIMVALKRIRQGEHQIFREPMSVWIETIENDLWRKGCSMTSFLPLSPSFLLFCLPCLFVPCLGSCPSSIRFLLSLHLPLFSALAPSLFHLDCQVSLSQRRTPGRQLLSRDEHPIGIFEVVSDTSRHSSFSFFNSQRNRRSDDRPSSVLWLWHRHPLFYSPFGQKSFASHIFTAILLIMIHYLPKLSCHLRTADFFKLLKLPHIAISKLPHTNYHKLLKCWLYRDEV